MIRAASRACGTVIVATLLLTAVLCRGARGQEAGSEAHILRLEGMITKAGFLNVRGYINEAREQGVPTFILELDTPGGTIQDSMDLADFIFALEDIQIVAYVHNQALSGGTMVALACDAIYIDASVGQMGDVAPVDISGQILSEKIQTVVRETMANYARARAYPEALVKAMVTKEVEVFQVQTVDDPEGSWSYVTGVEFSTWSPEQREKVLNKELVVASNELLTMSGQRAVELGFARKAVRSPQELYDTLGLKPESVERIYLTGAEKLLNFLDALSPLLIVGGFVLVFLELTQPGLGLPGLLGVICFAAFFFIKFSLNYAHIFEVLLFVLGLALLMVEIFIIPGFGIAGVSGIVLMFVALVLAFQEFDLPRTPLEVEAFQYNLLKVVGSLAGAAVGIGLMVRLMPSMPGFRRIMNVYSLADASVGEMQERRTPGLQRMVGEVGTALTALRPAGRAEFGEMLLDVVTEGEFVEKGETVRIAQVHGNRVVVERCRRM